MADAKEASKEEVLEHIMSGYAQGFAVGIFTVSGDVGYITGDMSVRVPSVWRSDIDEAVRHMVNAGRREAVREW
jgi:hypothetical protein